MAQQKKPRNIARWIRRVALILILLTVAGLLVFNFFNDSARSLSMTELNDKIRAGQVAEATFSRDSDVLEVKLKGDGGDPHSVSFPPGVGDKLYDDLKAGNVDTRTQGPSVWSVVTQIGKWLFWGLLVIVALNLITGINEYARKQKVQVGKVERPTTTFDDVQGQPEAVSTAQEIVDILNNPQRYREMGARLPAGAILYGPPGTGKTLLARAIAGQAGVPFYKVTGAELMSKWFGSSAQKIRKLYAEARQHPGGAIVFIDEGDSIGARRSDRTEGADQERNSALTQLLSELDGFERSKVPVFTIVATNKPKALDEALTRSGRFDIQLELGAPNVRGREAILRLYAAKMPLAEGVDLSHLAKQTIGSSGADLERLANEAALTAVRAKADKVELQHFLDALDTIQAGPKRKGLKVSEHDRRVTAYHEAGHTLAALMQPNMIDPVRVTIVPRAQSGGHTKFGQDEDQLALHKQQALAQLVSLMGGRAAEKILCGHENFTSGPSDDLKQATNLAEHMVCQWGMGTYNTSIPLQTWRQSPHAVEVERQVEQLLDDAELAAIELLLRHQKALEAMVETLLAEETIEAASLRPFADIDALTEAELAEVRGKYKPVIDSVRTQINGALAPVG